MFTYIVKTGIYYKIGRSEDVQNRMNQHKTSNPDITLVKMYNGDFEKELHNLFETKRHTREWFVLTNKDLKKIDKTVDKISEKPEHNPLLKVSLGFTGIPEYSTNISRKVSIDYYLSNYDLINCLLELSKNWDIINYIFTTHSRKTSYVKINKKQFDCLEEISEDYYTFLIQDLVSNNLIRYYKEDYYWLHPSIIDNTSDLNYIWKNISLFIVLIKAHVKPSKFSN